MTYKNLFTELIVLKAKNGHLLADLVFVMVVVLQHVKIKLLKNTKP
jgi:hypothetical protein